MGAHERLVVLEDRDLEVGNLVGMLRARVESLEARIAKLEAALTKIETYLYRHTGGGVVGKALPWYGDGSEAAKLFPDVPKQEVSDVSKDVCVSQAIGGGSGEDRQTAEGVQRSP